VGDAVPVGARRSLDVGGDTPHRAPGESRGLLRPFGNARSRSTGGRLQQDRRRPDHRRRPRLESHLDLLAGRAASRRRRASSRSVHGTHGDCDREQSSAGRDHAPRGGASRASASGNARGRRRRDGRAPRRGGKGGRGRRRSSRRDDRPVRRRRVDDGARCPRRAHVDRGQPLACRADQPRLDRAPDRTSGEDRRLLRAPGHDRRRCTRNRRHADRRSGGRPDRGRRRGVGNDRSGCGARLPGAGGD
jgi:hypothetical protein